MTFGTDRRSVLTGLGALGVMGCGEAVSRKAPSFETAVDLSALEARHGGRLGVSVHSQYGVVNWRAEERFTYCSTFKLFLAAAVLQRVGAGEDRLDRAVPVTAADMVMHAPVTQPAVGSSLTIEQLCRATVEVSDNPAANILIREMGGLDVFRDWYRSIGDEVTRVDRMEPQLNAFAPGDERDTTTPKQATLNLITVLDTEWWALIVPQHRRLNEWLLASPTGPGRIKAGVPEGFRVAHKTGTNGDGPTNDIGIILTPSETAIAIAVYYHATEASNADQRDAVIAEATRLALAALPPESLA